LNRSGVIIDEHSEKQAKEMLMATTFFNHLAITGPADQLDDFKRWCGLNEEMIDVDDGASDAGKFDEKVNYNNHKDFMEFVKTETNTHVDRIRLHSRDTGGLLICLDSCDCHFGSHTHWMADNFPTLTFDVAIIQDPYFYSRLVFVDGKWIAYSCDTEPPIEDNEDPRVSFQVAGYFGDYSDQKLDEVCDLGSLDAELQALVDSYKLQFWEGPWVKLQREAEEEIERWGA
jgi:hypothetical protein